MIQLTPRQIRLETAHYVVRTLGPGDRTEAWQDWLTDPLTSRMLNAKPERLSKEALDQYIASFDGATKHLLGIFDKETQDLVGVRAIYIDPQARAFLVNVLIDRDARRKGARSETRTVMYRYFFEEMDLLTAYASVVEGNEPVLKVMRENGWIEGPGEAKPSATGTGSIQLRNFRLPREVWREKERQRNA